MLSNLQLIHQWNSSHNFLIESYHLLPLVFSPDSQVVLVVSSVPATVRPTVLNNLPIDLVHLPLQQSQLFLIVFFWSLLGI